MNNIQKHMFIKEYHILSKKRTDPERSVLWYNDLGICLFKIGEYDRALKAYCDAIAIDKYYLDAYINKGICLKELNQDAYAIQEFDNAINLNKNFALAYYNKAVVLSTFCDNDKKEEAIENIIKLPRPICLK